MKNKFNFLWALLLIVVGTQISCKDEDEPEVLSSFTYAVDATDFKKVTFTNSSVKNQARILPKFKSLRIMDLFFSKFGSI